MTPTYGYVTKLFLESEFQHKGNKQTKKRKFSAKSCGFLGRNRFSKQKYLNTTQKRIKNIWTKVSSFGQEPTFKVALSGEATLPVLFLPPFSMGSLLLILFILGTRFWGIIKQCKPCSRLFAYRNF